MSRPAVALMRFATSAPAPDIQLLRAFVTSRKEDAFSELVRRHRPMVLAACTRVLSDANDAEDAFQATFLVLARRPSAVRGTNLAGWLYGVAVRTARAVRLTRDRRRKRDVKGAGKSRRGRIDPVPAPDLSLAVTERAAIIDEELAKLSAPHRDALVLCELRGLSRKQAAAELGIQSGTLSSRLAAAKRKLGERLAARGLAPAAAALAGALVPTRLPAALIQATAVAVRGAVGGTANAAASAVIKAMLFDRLRTTALTVSMCLVCVAGGLTMTGGGAAPAGDTAPAPRPVEDEAFVLVRRLGSSDFAERESAEKELRGLGLKAESALKTGWRSENPEVRARCAALLAAVRKDALDALVKGFDPKADRVPDHPVWRRFKAVAGDTPASRDIFTRIISNRRWLQQLDRVEANPESAAQAYREECIEIGRQVMTPHLRQPYPSWDRIEGAAFLLMLGSYPGTTLASPKNPGRDAELASVGDVEISECMGLENGRRGEQVSYGVTPDYPKPPELKAAVPGTDRVFMRLLAAWLPLRNDPRILANGFSYARRCSEGESFLFPFARKYALSPSGTAHAKCAALGVIAETGTSADLPLFEAIFDDREVCFALDTPIPGTFPSRATVVQYRDVAVALALLLCDRDPLEFGFENATNPWAVDGRKRKVANYESTLFGFSNDNLRNAAHAKARQFFDRRKKQPIPVNGARFWPRFARWVGDDKMSRELFDLMASEPKNLELLEHVEDVLQKGLALDASPELLSGPEKLYRTRCDELNGLASAGKPLLPAAICGWMYLGTFPRTSRPSKEVCGLRFMPWGDHGPDRVELVRHFTGPGAAAWGRLLGAWAEQHVSDDSCRPALEFALRHDIKETFNASRKVLETCRGPFSELERRKIASALLTVGKYGYENDAYFLTLYSRETDLCFGRLYNAHRLITRSDSKETTGVTTQLGDVAFAAMILRCGGTPEDFGFIWTKTGARKLVPWADQLGSELRSWEAIGFSRAADRAAARQKAATWLEQKKKWVGDLLQDKREGQHQK
ncbi:sigma-70 family RNA polymerase sigma factor [Gemmata sp. G18]|uniref:Sigma-70 family RNA polymerase sigma factor n=1 Tax=Gemmata palustris TaxID=2822762 RepID=A0ABS5BNI9_9BACT|nr:sigma-70 family RNA polymerase sigma factor [Gemmata palustris]MBP3954890.1 sigma-70 family RNA polymerase sigma factor [Gemmata palustris]